jgi:hypothetical protein
MCVTLEQIEMKLVKTALWIHLIVEPAHIQMKMKRVFFKMNVYNIPIDEPSITWFKGLIVLFVFTYKFSSIVYKYLVKRERLE